MVPLLFSPRNLLQFHLTGKIFKVIKLKLRPPAVHYRMWSCSYVKDLDKTLSVWEYNWTFLELLIRLHNYFAIKSEVIWFPHPMPNSYKSFPRWQLNIWYINANAWQSSKPSPQAVCNKASDIKHPLKHNWQTKRATSSLLSYHRITSHTPTPFF